MTDNERDDWTAGGRADARPEISASQFDDMDDMWIELILHPARYPTPFWLVSLDGRGRALIDDVSINAARRIAAIRGQWDE